MVYGYKEQNLFTVNESLCRRHVNAWPLKRILGLIRTRNEKNNFTIQFLRYSFPAETPMDSKSSQAGIN